MSGEVTRVKDVPETWEVQKGEAEWTYLLAQLQRYVAINTGRIEQLEAKKTDWEEALQQKNVYTKPAWWGAIPVRRLARPVYTMRVGYGQMTVLELGGNAELPTLQLHTREAERASLDLTIPEYLNKLKDIERAVQELDSDFGDVALRITRCALLEAKLGELEDSLEDDELENMAWCVSLVRDVLAYNYAEDLDDIHLILIKEAIETVSKKQARCTREDYALLHSKFLETEVSLLPNSQKAIDLYGR